MVLGLVGSLLSMVLCANLLFCKSVGCGGPTLTGGASGQGVFRGTFGPGPLVGKKTWAMFFLLESLKLFLLRSLSFCKQHTHTHTHTHTQRYLSPSFSLCLSFLNESHTQAHKRTLWWCSVFFLLLYSLLSSALTFIICLFVCLFFVSSIFVLRKFYVAHALPFKGYDANKHPKNTTRFFLVGKIKTRSAASKVRENRFWSFRWPWPSELYYTSRLSPPAHCEKRQTCRWTRRATSIDLSESREEGLLSRESACFQARILPVISETKVLVWLEKRSSCHGNRDLSILLYTLVLTSVWLKASTDLENFFSVKTVSSVDMVRGVVFRSET